MSWVQIPSPTPTARKIHVDSAALPHQPSFNLRPKRLDFAPILRPSFSRAASIEAGYWIDAALKFRRAVLKASEGLVRDGISATGFCARLSMWSVSFSLSLQQSQQSEEARNDTSGIF